MCCLNVLSGTDMLRRADVTYFANALLKCANVLLKCADVLLKRAKWYRHASTCRRDVLCKCAA